MDPSRRFRPPVPCRRRRSAISQNNKERTTSVFGGIRGRTYYFRQRKKVDASEIESIPNELLIEILVRLPADEICEKLRFVCRNWYHIIHSHAFMEAHRQNSNSNWGLLLYVREHADRPMFLGVRQGRIELSKLDYIIFAPFPTSCNGLFLSMNNFKSNNIHFVNLATKQVFRCPQSCPGKVMCCPFGMAYVAASMEYKVVRTYTHSYGTSIFCHILTVGVDKKWRSVGVDNLPFEAKKLLLSGPLITPGFMHWTQGWEGTRVLTLNVETEMFTGFYAPLLSHPEFSANPGRRRRRCKFYVSTGMRLCLFSLSREWDWEVWEMEGESGEWTKLLPNFNLEAHTQRLRQTVPCDEHARMMPSYDELLCDYCSGVLEPLGWVKYPVLLALRYGSWCIVYNLATDEIDFSMKLRYPWREYIAVAHRNTLEWLT